MDPTEEKVLNAVESLKGDMVSFLQDLVRHPSTLGNERGAQELFYAK